MVDLVRKARRALSPRRVTLGTVLAPYRVPGRRYPTVADYAPASHRHLRVVEGRPGRRGLRLLAYLVRP